MSYDNSKQVILRKVVSDKPKAPDLSLSFEIDGKKMQAPLWKWTKKDGTPVLDKNGNGMYQGEYAPDTWEPEQKAEPEPVMDDDSDLPF